MRFLQLFFVHIKHSEYYNVYVQRNQRLNLKNLKNLFILKIKVLMFISFFYSHLLIFKMHSNIFFLQTHIFFQLFDTAIAVVLISMFTCLYKAKHAMNTEYSKYQI